MKVSHIIIIGVIAVAIAMIISTTGDASKYVDFGEASKMAQVGNNAKIHVVGTLKKSAQGQILETYYNPAENPNYFTFTLRDNAQRECKVVYRNPKPQDFERSEQVVVIGKMQGQEFHADKILLKCPSKYQEQDIKAAKTDAKGQKM